MAEKTKSTQEELPLHEVVLKLMFEFNKEKPAELTSTDIFWKISDPSLNELQITQVLNWLVNEKRLVLFAGKYALDRFEFLDQRNRDNAETNPNSATSTASKQEIPLHETVLKIMFEANREKPAELTAIDIYWKTSDPAVSERNIVEVLNWLVAQRKVDHFAGKYSLDRFEFLEQKTADKPIEKNETSEARTVGKKAQKPIKTEVKPEPKVVKEEPKKTEPPRVEETPKPKVNVEEKRVPKVKEEPTTRVEQEISSPASPPITPKRWDRFNTTLAVFAGIVVLYTLYLTGLTFSSPIVSSSTKNIQTEITQLEKQFEALNEIKSSGSDDQRTEKLERKLELFQEISQLRSDQLLAYQKEISANSDHQRLLLRLIVSNLLLLIILGTAVARRF